MYLPSPFIHAYSLIDIKQLYGETSPITIYFAHTKINYVRVRFCEEKTKVVTTGFDYFGSNFTN